MSALRSGASRRALLGGMALALLGARAARAAEPVYHFSPVNLYGINITAGYWNPILAWVSERSGVRLQLKIGRTSADTTAYVLAQEVDFVFTNHLFSPEREKLGWKVFGRRLTPPTHGVIVVPEDSPITKLEQLAGKDVSFPGPEATISYKFTYNELLARGIDARPVFAGNADAAFAQLFSGKVAATGVNQQLAEGYTRREGKRFRTLWATAAMHDLALMHSSRVPARDVQAVARAFLSMHQDPQGLEILAQACKLAGLKETAHFVASDGSDYAPYREAFRTLAPQLR